MNPQDIPADAQDRVAAAFEMFGRAGAAEARVGFYDDEQPATVWVTTVVFRPNKRSRNPAKPRRIEVAAALDPVSSVERLLELVIDSSQCTHCGRPTAAAPVHTETFLESSICWYAYDPELKTYRRACEGDAP